MKVMDVNTIQYDCDLIKQSTEALEKIFNQKILYLQWKCEFEIGGNISAMGGSP